MLRWWLILVVGSASCSLVTTQKIPLILFADVPVPADARWTNAEEEEIGGDGGGGFLFLNNQADPTEGVFGVLETDEVEGAEQGAVYYQGTESRTFFSLLVFFFEGVSFDAKMVRLKARPLPAEVVSAVETSSPPAVVRQPEPEPAPESEPEPESTVESEIEAAPAEPAAVEPPEEEPKTKKKKRKGRKRNKRKKRGSP